MQQMPLKENPLLASSRNPYSMSKEKEYATSLGMPPGGKPRSYGDYSCIWDAQYPMTLQASHDDSLYTSSGRYRDTMESTPDTGYSSNIPYADHYDHRVEHIYESPKFTRSSMDSDATLSNTGPAVPTPMYFDRNQPQHKVHQHLPR